MCNPSCNRKGSFTSSLYHITMRQTYQQLIKNSSDLSLYILDNTEENALLLNALCDIFQGLLKDCYAHFRGRVQTLQQRFLCPLKLCTHTIENHLPSGQQKTFSIVLLYFYSFLKKKLLSKNKVSQPTLVQMIYSRFMGFRALLLTSTSHM